MSGSSKRSRDENDNHNDEPNEAIPCDICSSSIPIHEWSLHAATHQQQKRHSPSSSAPSSLSLLSSQSKRARIDPLPSTTVVTEPADDDNNNGRIVADPEVITIPCDICGEPITFTGYDEHIARLHSSSASVESKRESPTTISTSPFVATAVMLNPFQAKRVSSPALPTTSTSSSSSNLGTRSTSLIPCEVQTVVLHLFLAFIV
jgi:hypothetical protein